MLQFETLLLRQLQKQQNRDEFCDTVLHTQGMSVPVHSCVLSAFSPRLYGTLSSMPVPMTGRRRLIELQAVDACTLLSLVRLLYSGQLHENREQVLSAAKTLGIELPQWKEKEDRHGGKVGRSKEKEGAGQVIEKEVDATEWDDRMTGRMEEDSGGETEKMRESGTQTECGRETDERGADLTCAEPQNSQTIHVMEQSTCSTNQEPGSYLQVINPESQSTTCNVLAMAPETGDCHIVSDSARVSQICLYFMETSHHQPSTSVTPHPHNSFLEQSLVEPTADAVNDLKQFEGNIPGFISYFLDSNDCQNIGRKEQKCAREGAKEEQVVKRAKAMSTVVGSVREWVRCIGGGQGGRRQKCKERCGLVARLAWQGQGGGRVGRQLGTRSTVRKSMTAFRRGKKALLEAGEARGRGRRGHRVRTGTVARNEGQNDPPRKRRPRGRPRTRPLLPASRSSSPMMYTVDPTELDLLHTVTPTPSAQMESIQPIDTLLNDIMNGLNFLPPAETQTNQRDIMSTTTSDCPPISKAMYPNSHSVKPTNPMQHLEGELSDILDHFLKTYDQQVGCCSLDMGDETLQDKFVPASDKSDPRTDPWSSTPKTYTHLQSDNPQLQHQKPHENCLHTSSTLSTQPQTTLNKSVAQKTSGQDGKLNGSKMENPSTDQNIVQQFENQRLTRSQSMKRKMETVFLLPGLQNLGKRKSKDKQSADKKKRQRDDQEKSEACANKSGVNILDKNNKKRAPQVCSEGRQKQASARETRCRGTRKKKRKKRSVENRNHRMADFYERKKSPQERIYGINGCCETKKNFGEDHVEAEGIFLGFRSGQSSVKRQIGGTCLEIASSAVEKVRMLLQLQNEEEDERASQSVGTNLVNQLENGKLVNHTSILGTEEGLPDENSLPGHLGEIQEPEDEGRVMVNREFEGQGRVNSIVEVSQRQEDEERTASGLRQEKMTREECRAPFQLNLPSNAGFLAKEGNNDSEATLSTIQSVANILDSCLGDPVSALGIHLLQSEVVQPSTQSTMQKMVDLTLDVGDAPQLTSHAQPCQELLSPHTSMEDMRQLAGSSVDKDDDVDVLEVSSPTSELPAVSTVILGVDLSTEEEVEEDVEIDVLGLDPD